MNNCPKCQRPYDPLTFYGCPASECAIRNHDNPIDYVWPYPNIADDPVQLIPRDKVQDYLGIPAAA